MSSLPTYQHSRPEQNISVYVGGGEFKIKTELQKKSKQDFAFFIWKTVYFITNIADMAVFKYICTDMWKQAML